MSDQSPALPSNKLLANIAHAVLHILDDAEENAQTGVVSIEISKDDWAELNRVMDLISDDPHETLHDLIGVNESKVVDSPVDEMSPGPRWLKTI